MVKTGEKEPVSGPAKKRGKRLQVCPKCEKPTQTRQGACVVCGTIKPKQNKEKDAANPISIPVSAQITAADKFVEAAGGKIADAVTILTAVDTFTKAIGGDLQEATGLLQALQQIYAKKK